MLIVVGWSPDCRV